MKAIYKYLVEPGMGVKVPMPQHAEVFSAIESGNSIWIYALVETEQEIRNRIFNVVGTGWELTEHPGDFIATVKVGPFVWHVFQP